MAISVSHQVNWGQANVLTNFLPPYLPPTFNQGQAYILTCFLSPYLLSTRDLAHPVLLGQPNLFVACYLI